MKRTLSALALCALPLGVLVAPVSADPAASVQLVRDSTPGNALSGVGEGVALGSRLVYSYYDGAAHGWEPWISDGTAAGTMLIRDLYPGAGDSQIGDLTAYHGRVYFRATDGVHGNELWVTDGTAAGTTMLVDAVPGANGSDAGENLIRVAGDTLYFVADTVSNDDQLWKTDGTVAGTKVVALIGTPAVGGNIGQLAPWGNKLLFQADDGVHGSEPWVSDGTAVGTKMIKDLDTTASSAPWRFTTLGSRFVFSARPTGGNPELWVSDGTAAGTAPVPGTTSSWPDQLVANNGHVLYSASDGAGDELWTSDGTTASRLKDINPGAGSGAIQAMTVFNGRVFFGASDASGNNELWTSDGTAAGTTKVRDIATTGGSYPAHFLALGSTLFFEAQADATGYELWRTDGTGAGTALVADILPGATGSYAQPLAAVGGTLFFEAEEATHGQELWSYSTLAPAPVAHGSTTAAQARKQYSRAAARKKRIYVTVTVRAAGTTPTGTVLLKKGSVTIGRATLAGGTARVRITKRLIRRTTRIVAVYGGSAEVTGSQSAVVRIRLR